jgi:hypothetical protein
MADILKFPDFGVVPITPIEEQALLLGTGMTIDEWNAMSAEGGEHPDAVRYVPTWDEG